MVTHLFHKREIVEIGLRSHNICGEMDITSYSSNIYTRYIWWCVWFGMTLEIPSEPAEWNFYTIKNLSEMYTMCKCMHYHCSRYMLLHWDTIKLCTVQLWSIKVDDEWYTIHNTMKLKDGCLNWFNDQVHTGHADSNRSVWPLNCIKTLCGEKTSAPVHKLSM